MRSPKKGDITNFCPASARISLVPGPQSAPHLSSEARQRRRLFRSHHNQRRAEMLIMIGVSSFCPNENRRQNAASRATAQISASNSPRPKAQQECSEFLALYDQPTVAPQAVRARVSRVPPSTSLTVGSIRLQDDPRRPCVLLTFAAHHPESGATPTGLIQHSSPNFDCLRRSARDERRPRPAPLQGARQVPLCALARKRSSSLGEIFGLILWLVCQSIARLR